MTEITKNRSQMVPQILFGFGILLSIVPYYYWGRINCKSCVSGIPSNCLIDVANIFSLPSSVLIVSPVFGLVVIFIATSIIFKRKFKLGKSRILSLVRTSILFVLLLNICWTFLIILGPQRCDFEPIPRSPVDLPDNKIP
jgi:hypothetical protein